MRNIIVLLLLSPSALAAPAPTALPKDLEDFLGAPPARFEQKFRRPAKQLKAAFDLLRAKKTAQAMAKLQPLAASGEFAEHASFELANLHRERKEFAKSSTQAEKFLRAFPDSTYADRMEQLLDQNECDQGLADAGRARTDSKREAAARLLQRCLWRVSWRSWNELEPQATALYEILRATKDPLLDPFIAEIIQARPSNSALRQRIAKEIPAEKLDQLAAVARFRTKSATAAGVKAVSPDQELFDSAMKAVMREDWSEANSLFKRFPAEFPQSEHWDRAQYWIARTEEQLGNSEEAKKRFEQVLAENPFTYYGLQSALRLKHDWSAAVAAPAPNVSAKFAGSVLTRPALSLWRLRALLELGLIDYAREEAKFLHNARPGGVVLGQEEAAGALMMARIYHQSGFHMAAFTHAYAALSLEPTLVNSSSLEFIFPQAFIADFNNASEKTGVNSLLLASVAKQESAFLPNAVSRSDALGLMQLLYSTAQEVIPKVSRTELFQPDINTMAGSLYLAKLLLRFDGNVAMALAGYNAGPNRMAQWQKEFSLAPLMKQSFDLDAFIDSIPFAETRKYVANIMRNYAWYRLLAKETKVSSSVQELLFQWQKPEKNPILLPISLEKTTP